MKKSGHANIPLFIPHLGCPCRCVFCDQKSISGSGAFIYENAKKTLEAALETLKDRKSEIAFFGGSFTAIDRELMIRLLDLAAFYKNSGRVDGIRLSTRPDCIDDETVGVLARYGVTAIELGVQSMDDAVLLAAQRGHTASDVEKAFACVKKANGISLVGQMMLGLPASSLEKELYTAQKIASMGADGARIYPTAVLAGTPLEKMMNDGVYTPLRLEEGVRRGAACYSVFQKSGVRVLRLGLCAEEDCAKAVVGGCYHPAYGEMVKSRLYLEKLKEAFEEAGVPKEKPKCVTVFAAKGETSAVTGYKRQNIIRLTETYGCAPRVIEDPLLEKWQLRIVKGEQRALKKS